MEYMGPRNNIVLTNLTSKLTADVICFHSIASWGAFQEYASMVGLSYVFLTPSDAAKILYQQGGVGFGCYTMEGVSCNHTNEEQRRKALAATKKNEIAEITGICSIATPLRLDVDPADSLHPQASERASAGL